MNFRKILALSLLAPAFLAAGAAALDTPTHNHAVTLLADGNILVTGGRTAVNIVSARVEMYNMATNLWVNMAALSVPRSSHTATLMSDGRVLIAGGFTGAGTPTSSIEIYDPKNGSLAGGGTLTPARGGHTATLLTAGTRAGEVLICGGQSGGATTITPTCDYVSITGAVTDGPSMVSARVGHAATLLHSGRVFVSGGRLWNGSAWVYEAMNEMYDPAAGSWTPVDSLNQGRTDHTVTVLNNGKIMIAGGYNATNRLRCMYAENSLEEDCWHSYNPLAAIAQNAGNRGYLDGAEFFDQNGARVTLMEDTFNLMPYRTSRHTAVLETDGRWRAHRGYGNIYPTFFTNSPTLADTGTIIRLDTVAGSSTTATVRPDSAINFPLAFKLVRPVSGRLVDADLFISSPPSAGTPSITIANAQFSLGQSTAIADGRAVGRLLGAGYAPGDFNAVVSLNNPAGSAVFEPVTVDIAAGTQGNTVSSSFSGAAIYPTDVGALYNTSTMTVNVSFQLSDVYRSRVRGAATISSATLAHTDYTINLNGGVATFNFPAGACNDTDDVCTFSGNLYFPALTGTLTNLTALAGGTTFFHAAQSPPAYRAPMNVGARPIEMTLRLDFTADEVHIRDKNATYSFDRSTAVIRGMLFSNHLAYSPQDNRWSDLSNIELAGLHSVPSFDHTATYTPAADTLLLGGRNCETATPLVQCARPGTFTPNTADYGLIPVVEGNWATGPKLGSRRAFHSSTLLPDGRILTCGGTDGASPLSTCELLDPATNKWGATGGMNSHRANHTATLLPNGQVLAAGGITPGGTAVASAEIYYPDTRTWVPTGSMSSVRQLHTATLMPDGNVLVTGGASISTYSATAEIYITSAAHWAAGGTLVTGRSQHTATLLKSGLVLIAGGINGSGAIAAAELYNYLTRTSLATATPMFSPRYNHTANLLRDGRVLIAGGSDGIQSSRRTELYTAAGTWVETALLNLNRASHRTVLLPNGKVMLTGGEISGVVQSMPESFDPDLPSWSGQGSAEPRSRHTSVLTRDNRIINIGGWNGGQYLDTTEYTDFNFWPDSRGLTAGTTRQPLISTGTAMFDHGWRATLLSNTSNFHGITEAAGGGAGAMTSSHSNPRVYMQQIDNPGGFMIDLSTRIYSLYGGPNTVWSRTLSSITVITPSLPNEMPRGWYHMRVAANGVFSNGFTVQVSTPRPAGRPAFVEPNGVVQGISSITWTWNKGDVNAADGFAVYSASNSVFITTVAFVDPGDVFYTQTGLAPNTPASIMVSAYNQGGHSGLTRSGTFYTLAAPPANLTITDVSFETVTLAWSANGNSSLTRYELSMSTSSNFSINISTPVSFDDGFTSTTYTVTGIEPNNLYYFRVRARNGDGTVTLSTPAAPPYISTVTVAQVQSLQGTPLSGYQISWSWVESVGADYYEIYDISSGTDTAVLISSPVYVAGYTQTGLSTNTVHQVMAYAVKTTGYGPVRGSPGYSPWIYTLANPPAPWSFTGVSTNTITLRWLANGNPSYTDYVINHSLHPDFAVFTSSPVLAATSYPLGSLVPNTVYYARVYALNGNGVPTAAVSLGSKYTHAQPPTGVTTAEIAMSGVTLTWNQGRNPLPTYYEVRGSTNNFVDVSTHVLFAQYFSGNTVTVTGLLTSTTYQFDVAAKNGENVITARTRVVPDVFTLAGPAGTPSGAVGGTGVPGVTSVIAGTLPNGHSVSMTIPPAAFQAETAVAISSRNLSVISSTDNPCGVDRNTLPVLAVDIYSEGGTQPFEPVSFTIGYGNMSSVQRSQINQNISKLVWARYNPVNGQCLPLETSVNTGNRTITASLNHFSIFQLIIKDAATNLSGVLIYPNPFYPNRGQGFVTLTNLPAAANIKIYTLSGTKVWEGTATGSGVLIWRGVNESGNPVGSGVYFVSVKSTGGDKIFKLAVER
ncbi:MAG: fibronectin type III domain-containing protein [Elusimicrobia bacterium]|nr:MAG: fibronectin type III domain-containing protein [Elusimicrobiota bacterium]KAF0155961.1 MAG: fibronectin type III domain-containing protein [Elusimicrobiota bacterium]